MANFRPIIVDPSSGVPFQQLQAGNNLTLGTDDLLCGDITAAGSVVIGGTLTVTGATTLGDDTSIDGDLTVTGAINALTTDKTIYVDTGGNDTTGDGTSGNPYASLTRAATDYVRLNPGNFTITVHLNAGVYTLAERFQVAYPYGANLVIEGETETLAAPAVSNIDGTASTDGDYTGLQYFDFDLDVTGTGAAAGHFVSITTATGGTRPELLNGLHRIESVASNTATCRVWQDAGAAALLPSGAITVTNVKLLKTVLHFTDDAQGVFLNGISAMGEWNNIVIEGNADAYASARAGIEMFGGASFRSTSGIYVHGWGRGFQPFGEGIVYAQAGGISKIKDFGINSGNTGMVRFTGGTINGTGSHAVQAAQFSRFILTSTKIHSHGGSCLLADTGGLIYAGSTTLSYPGDASSTAAFARDLGQINVEGATITGYGTDFNPDEPFGNDYGLVLHSSEIGVQPSHSVLGYGSGANYTVTTSSAEVDEGTDSAIVLDQAGTYLVSGWCELYYSACTFNTSRAVTFKLRRTNNTAADLTNGSVQHQTFQLTLFTGSIHLSIPPVSYATTNTDDRITLFIDVASAADAGSIQVVQSSITAERIA